MMELYTISKNHGEFNVGLYFNYNAAKEALAKTIADDDWYRRLVEEGMSTDEIIELDTDGYYRIIEITISNEYRIIRKSRLDSLLLDSWKLEGLENYGVDNWKVYETQWVNYTEMTMNDEINKQ